MKRLAVDIDETCSLSYYPVEEIHPNYPLNFGSSYKINFRLDIDFDSFQLLAIL